MSSLFTSTHEDMRRGIRKFVDQELNPHADKWEAAGAAPLPAIFARAGELGLLGINKPAEFGGLGLDFSYVMVAAEELGHAHSPSIPFAIGAHLSAIPALTAHGNDALRNEFLVPAISGEAVASIGVSESGAGSDVSAIKTTARKDGGDYVINGAKMWITNSTHARWISLLVNTSEEGGPYRNKSLILVPMDTRGVSVGKPLHKLGMQCSDTAPVFFDEVRVPQRHLIGEEGKGFIYQMEQFQHERLWACLRSISALDDAIALTVDYTRERRTFGKPLIENQALYHRLADYLSQIEAARSMAYRAGEALVSDLDVTRLVSMAKYLVGKLALEVPSTCAQYFGGQGYMWENRITRMLRDLRIVAVGGGANEIMLDVIAKEMGWIGKRSPQRGNK
ncbi:acyl-CoA dehydrogenase family protein [Herbaspirillum sp. GCM10030257]|uniref:acyl-CoA dehydrogenase family protein n=1 Tax=Herbaspirillum sp. GCM10030257 TaxID=3273393 RepID=UPI003620853C